MNPYGIHTQPSCLKFLDNVNWFHRLWKNEISYMHIYTAFYFLNADAATLSFLYVQLVQVLLKCVGTLQIKKSFSTFNNKYALQFVFSFHDHTTPTELLTQQRRRQNLSLCTTFEQHLPLYLQHARSKKPINQKIFFHTK